MVQINPPPGAQSQLSRSVDVPPWPTPVNPAQSVGATDGEELNVGQFISVLQRRRRLALIVFFTVLTIGGARSLYELVVEPVYQGDFKLLVTDPINSNDSNKVDAASSLENLAIQRSGSVSTPVLIQVLRSSLLLEPVARRTGIRLSDILGSLRVSDADRKTEGVLNVTLQWGDPKTGEQLLSAIANEYLAYSLKQRQEKLRQGLAFLDEQAPALQQRVNKVEEELAAFRTRNSFIEPGPNAEAIQKQRQDLRQTMQDLAQKQARLEVMLSEVQAGRVLGTSSLGIDDTSDSSRGLELRRQLTEVEEQLAQARASYSAATPLVQNLTRRREELRALQRQRDFEQIITQLSGNRAQQQEVVRQENLLARQLSRNPELIKQYDGIQQRLAVAKDNFTGYIKARENFRLEVAQRTVPWQVIDVPEFGPKPVKPDLSRNLMLWSIISGSAALAASFLRDRADHVFHSPRELEEDLELPLLGLIPHLKTEPDQPVVEAITSLAPEQRFAMRESLRNLFTSFQLLRADKPLRLILLTSSTQAEGKTTSTALFAKTLSDLGQRVLLVDADMRRPRLHRRIGADNTAGLSNLLTSDQPPDEATLTQLIQSIDANLDILTAGAQPPDAAKLLSSERYRNVCELLRSLAKYDLVLFDSPPALDLSDPVLLTKHLDGLLFLVGMERTDRSLPVQALRRIQGTGVDLLGVVANQVVAKRSIGYGYGYGYGNRYGYGRYQDLASRYQPAIQSETEQAEPPIQVPSPAAAVVVRLRKRLRQTLRWIDERI